MDDETNILRPFPEPESAEEYEALARAHLAAARQARQRKKKLEKLAQHPVPPVRGPKRKKPLHYRMIDHRWQQFKQLHGKWVMGKDGKKKHLALNEPVEKLVRRFLREHRALLDSLSIKIGKPPVGPRSGASTRGDTDSEYRRFLNVTARGRADREKDRWSRIYQGVVNGRISRSRADLPEGVLYWAAATQFSLMQAASR